MKARVSRRVRPASKPRRSGRPSRPRLEALEGRVVLTLSTSTWTPIGPAPVGILASQDFLGATSSSSGRIAAIAGDPTNANIIYIAAAGGGVFKTTDAGQSWTPLTDNEPTLFMGALAVAPSSPQTIYAGTGEANNSGDSFYGEGILKSTDGGSTWTLEDNSGAFDRRTVAKIAIDPTDPNTVYAAVDDLGIDGLVGNVGIWKTTDGGQTWTDTTTGISQTDQFTDVVIDPSHPQTVYAAVGSYYGSTANDVYKSTDGGTTWAPAGNFPTGGSDGRIALAISNSNPNTLYAAITVASNAGGTSGQLLEMEKSTDGGTTWTTLSSCPDFATAGQGDYDLAVAVDPSNPNIVYGAGVSDYSNVVNGQVVPNKLIVMSQDGGATWTDLSYDSTGADPHSDVHALDFDANGKLLLGSDGGIWRLDNNGPSTSRWTDLNTTGLQITQFTGIALDPNDPDVVFGGSQDNGTDRYANGVWTEVYGGDGGFTAVDPNNSQIVYSEYVFVTPVRSNDGGNTWTDISQGLNTSDPSNFYVPYAADPTTSGRLVYGTDHIYETTTYGNNWSVIATPNTAGFNSGVSVIDALAISKSDPNTIYATGAGQIFVTHNNGSSWTTVRPASAGDTFSGIAIDPTNANVAYVVRDAFNNPNNHGHILETTDGGVTWTDISGSGSSGLPDLPAHSVATGSINGVNYIWVGNDNGVYDSIDGGATWSKYLSGMPNVQVTSLQFNASLDILAAGTHGRGAFEIKPGAALNITPTPPSGLVEEVPFHGQVATFTDQSPAPLSSYSAEIFWGDGTSETGTIQVDPAGGFDVIGSKTYTVGGSYGASVTVSKSGTIPVTATAAETIIVGTDAIDALPVAIQAVQAEPFDGVVATFVDTYPLATTASDYTATIAWGDGSTTDGTVESDGQGGFKVIGSKTYGASGDRTALVTITGLGGAMTSVSDVVTVLPAVVITPVSFSPTIGEPFSGVVATFLSNDPSDPAPSTFHVQIAWGDGSTSPGVVTLGPGGVYSVEGSKTYAQVGNESVTITVTDRYNAINSATELIAVADAMISGSAETFQAVEGIPFSGRVATFSDPDTLATAGYFSATIDWGDGSTTTGTVVADGGGQFEVDGSHDYAKAGNDKTVVTIRDSANQTLPLDGLAQVAFATLTPIPDTLTVVEGTPLAGVVGSFNDPDPFARTTDFTALINWGDGTSSTGTLRPNASGGFDVVGTHTYTSVGTFSADVAVSEDGVLSTTIDSTVVVTAAPLSAVGVPFSTVEGDATTKHVVAHFTDGDTIVRPPSYYSATINWGDGTTSAGTVVADPAGGYDVEGAHAYQAGKYTFVVLIGDQGGASASASSTATITPAALTAGPPEAIVVGEGMIVNQVLGTFSDGNIYAPATNFSATINWGDGTSGVGVVTALGAGQFSVSGLGSTPHAYPAGTYSYSITVVDYAGPSATLTGTVTVTPAAISAQGVAVSASEGMTFGAVVATFADAAPQVNPASTFVATINWGDGTSSVGLVTSPLSGSYQVAGSHDYVSGGNYVVTTSIVSRGGSAASAESTASVAPAKLTASGLFFRPVEGVAYTGPVATFTDANPDHPPARDFVAIITWGDKAQSIGTVTFDPTTGLYSVSGSHVYNAGNYFATVSISDDGGASASANSPAYVAPSKLTMTPNPISATEAQPFNGVVAVFNDADPRQLTPDDFKAAIYWGDGTVSSGTIAVVPGGYAVTGSHMYLTVGPKSVGVLVESASGSSATTRTAASVAPAALSASTVPFSASQHVAFSGAVASFSDADPFLPLSNFSALISWGDGTVDPGTIQAIAPGAYQVVGSHTYAEGGPENVLVTVNDSGGVTASAGAVVSVADQLYPISLAIDPSTDTGPSSTDAITADRSPLFEGTAEPGAVVTLIAQRAPVASMITLGTAQADATGHWLFQSGPLTDGAYTFLAQAVDAFGRPSTLLTALPIDGRPDLVIDNTPPSVVSTSLDPVSDTIQIIYGDDLSGVSPLAIASLANYTLSAPFAKGSPTFAASSVVNPYPGSGGLEQVVDVHFNVPAKFRRGKLVLTLQGGGTTDLAGNVLSESHYVPLPSRGDIAGTVYQAQFTTNGKVSSGPEQYFSPAEIRGAAQLKKLTQARLSKGH